MASGVAAAPAFAAFLYTAKPAVLRGLNLGGGVAAALVVWLALR